MKGTKAKLVRGISVIAIAVLVAVTAMGCQKEQVDPSKLLEGVENIRHSVIKISSEKVIYVDPYFIDTEAHDADIVFVTHSHTDHLSLSDIEKVMKDGTVIVAPTEALEQIKSIGASKVIEVAPMKEYEAEGIKFKTVAAYNKEKDYHPKDNNWVGYIIYINDKSYYIAGDTDFIPEMENLKVDVAFLPVGGEYTMDEQEAAEAAKAIKTKVAVPVHYGSVIGSSKDAERFIELLDKDIKGVILMK